MIFIIESLSCVWPRNSSIKQTRNVCALDWTWKTWVNKRARATDDLLCTSAPCRKRPRYGNSPVLRQYDSSKICPKWRRPSVTFAPTIRTEINEILLRYKIRPASWKSRRFVGQDTSFINFGAWTWFSTDTTRVVFRSSTPVFHWLKDDRRVKLLDKLQHRKSSKVM